MIITTRKVLWTAAILVSIMAVYKGWSSEAIVHPPGVLVPESPRQEILSPGKLWQKGEFFFTSLAAYRMKRPKVVLKCITVSLMKACYIR